jgi:hypothetical protein
MAGMILGRRIIAQLALDVSPAKSKSAALPGIEWAQLC